jgi:mycothiol synthase
VPELPALPAGLTARPLGADDMTALAELLEAAEPVDDTGEHEDAEGLAEFLVNDRVDLGRDTVAVLAGDEVVAYASVVDLGDHRDEYAVMLDGCVHPRERGKGIGRALLGWEIARCGELHRERHPEMPGRFGVGVPSANTSLERLVQRAGFEPVQYYFVMRRPLTDLPPLRTREGIELAPYDRARDEEVRLAHNRAFVDHFGTAERDAFAWQTWFTGQKAFRPELSRLALAAGAVVGYALVYEHDADTAATGVREAYFGQIGVLPAARGRGVASACIVDSLHAAAADGMGRAGLTVDTNNTTGALALYERLGFVVEGRETVWALRVPAPDARAERGS